MKDKKVALAIFVLTVVHAVGLYGLAFSANPGWFRALSPVNLLLTILVLFAFHRTWTGAFFLFALTVMVVGFTSEIIGVHTGLLYGDYTYGAALGPKLWDIPLMIALNWLLLVYITGVTVQQLPVHWLLKAALAAGLMVLLDCLIEPVAHVLDFWTWQDYRIPASNYYGWLGVGFLLQVYFQKVGFRKDNPLALVIYGLQFLFFIGLNLLM